MKTKGKKIVVCCVVFVFIFVSGLMTLGQEQGTEPKSAAVSPSLDELEKLMKNKTIENCEKAIEGYKALLEKDPDNYVILYKLANAYTTIMDIKTAAFRVEKDEYKPMLKELGTIAYDYAAKAYKLKPDDKDVVAANLASYAYYSASFGIVKAILKGAAGHFKDLANQLIKLDAAYRGAMGYRMLGKLYHVAPWPVGSSKKAVETFKKAVETDNACLYSHYYLGLLYYQDKQYDLSEKEFQFVWDNEAPEHEKHYIDVYKKMARFYVRQIARITGKKK